MGKPELPLDTGWAWMICGAACFSSFTSSFVGQMAPILFVDLLEKYETTLTKASFMFLCFHIVFGLSSMAATQFLLPKFGERKLLIIGGLWGFVCNVALHLAPSIEVFIVLYAFKAVSAGTNFIPSMTLIRQYFKKHLSVASMLPFCAGSASAIVSPYLIRTLRNEYGISGTFLIAAAVELNICACGLLLRPVSEYRLPSDKPNEPTATPDGEEQETNLPKDNPAPPVQVNEPLQASGLPADNSEPLVQEPSRVPDVTKDNSSQFQEPLQAPVKRKDHVDTDPGVMERLLENTQDNSQNTFHGDLDRREVTQTLASPSHGGAMFGSTVSLHYEVVKAIDLMEQASESTDVPKKLSTWKRYYQNASLGLWGFRVLLIANAFGSVHVYLLVYMPTILYSLGASFSEIVILLTIYNGMDGFGRVLFGIIADTHILSPSTMAAICIIFLSVLLHLLRLATTFPALVGIIVLIGSVAGTRLSVVPLLCSQVVGKKNMPQAYGIASMIGMIMGAIWNPILSSIAQEMGSFISVLHIAGTLYIISALVMLTLPLFIRLDIKHERRQ